MTHTHGNCRTEEGITVGLIDSFIFISRIVAKRDLTAPGVVEALRDLRGDEDVQAVLGALLPAPALTPAAPAPVATEPAPAQAPAREWTPEEDDRLRELYTPKSRNVEIAAALGRPVGQIVCRALTLELSRDVLQQEPEPEVEVEVPPVTPEPAAAPVVEAPALVVAPEPEQPAVADVYTNPDSIDTSPEPVEAVNIATAFVPVAHEPAPLKRWTAEEDTYLKQNYDKLTHAQMAKHLGRTPAATSARCVKKGLRQSDLPKEPKAPKAPVQGGRGVKGAPAQLGASDPSASISNKMFGFVDKLAFQKLDAMDEALAKKALRFLTDNRNRLDLVSGASRLLGRLENYFTLD